MFGRTTSVENIKDLLHARFLDFEPLASIGRNTSFFPLFVIKLWLKYRLEKIVFKNSSLKGNEKVTTNKVWGIVSSLNNLNSLSFLKKELDDIEFVTTSSLKPIKGLEGATRLSWHEALKYKKNFKKIFNQLKSNDKASILKNNIYEAVGMLEASIEILKQGKPKALIFTNDHSLKHRSLLQAALFLKIPTIYIQHASVNEYFPALIFDLSLLEGQSALQAYKKCGDIRGKVDLIGMPKFDKYAQYRKHTTKINDIAVCANILDLQPRINKLLEYLEREFPEITIHFRPHPRDMRKHDISDNIRFSDSKKENVFELLKKVDFLIAGHTSTHLEAALLNIPSIYFDLGDAGLGDYYGYIKNNLIKEIRELDEIKQIVENFDQSHQVFKKAKFYNATVDTKFEGKSGELAGTYIRNFLA